MKGEINNGKRIVPNIDFLISDLSKNNDPMIKNIIDKTLMTTTSFKPYIFPKTIDNPAIPLGIILYGKKKTLNDTAHIIIPRIVIK